MGLSLRQPAPHADSYADMIRDFAWDIPETFNFSADVFDRWAGEGDGLALIWANAAGEEKSFLYSEMARLASRFANVLRAAGIGKGDRIIVMLPRIPEWMVAIVGALRIGAIPIPCVEMLTARDLDYRVENSGASAVVCRSGHVQKFVATRDRLRLALALGGSEGWTDYETVMTAASEQCEPAQIASEDPAIMYYTSGSTGHPKGVLHAARGLYAWRVSAMSWLDLRPGERIWCTADTGWSKAGTSILFGPWSCGACSFFYDGPFEPKERLRLLAKHRVTVYCAPGTELFRLIEEDLSAYDLSALRRTVSAGEAVNPAIAEGWEKATGLRIDEGYGQTEALMLVLNYPKDPMKYGSMGRPNPGSVVDVVDETGRHLPDDAEGDLAVLTPNPQMMLGYWQEPERTQATLRKGPEGVWYITGDRAARDADGYFWYRGRADDVINSAGYRIGPLEVENALLEHPAVQACAVVGSPDKERGEIVKAFVVLRGGYSRSTKLARELQDHVKSVTAPYKYPRAIEFVESLPMTVTGKIRRRELRDAEYAKG